MQIDQFLEEMVAEDLGRGDLFGRLSTSKPIRAYIIAKSAGVFGGRVYMERLAKLHHLAIEWHCEDGDAFAKGQKLLFVEGDSKVLLSLERSFLNLALHASSIATLTARYVEAISHTKVKLLDTRKTRPLLRAFEKYAVRCGGGVNHRMGLDDMLMLKDTHLQAIDDLEAFMVEIRQKIPMSAKIEIECESVAMAQEAMRVGADIVMCDNMGPDQIKEVVAFRNEHFGHILLEASGNVTLETIGPLAQTGVDAISSGAIIHQANWIDLSMKVEPS
jgi:nicotinate-nucleotide pyrophosphorylase (carboxylating)